MTLHRILALAAVTLSALTSNVLAQAVSSGQPVNSPVLSPTTPVTCVPGATYQDPRCAHTTLPAPVPAPPPAPKPSASPIGSGRLITGFTAGGAAGMQKVVSYFQRGTMQIDPKRAFGFVLMPKRALDETERDRQIYFCKFLLGALDYTTPDEAARSEVLATYWPLVADVAQSDIDAAFRWRKCDNLVDWYDHSLARSMARRAGIEGLGGPLLITWPSEDPWNPEARDPLVVDFVNADSQHATKALRYWFAQLSNDPSLWTDRIREGTIRAELADAINDTAGVVMAVLQGKWESAAAVTEAP